MENIPMLTENALMEIAVLIAGLVFFAGLFLWIITGRNKKLAKEHAEEMERYMDFDKSKIKSISVEHTEETKEDIDIKIALLEGNINHALMRGKQETVDVLRAKLNKLHMERGAKESLEDIAMTGDSTLPHSIGMPYMRHHLHFDHKENPVWEAHLKSEEHILDKINRLHTEMQECLPVENYERMAEIKKELNELYEAEPPKDFKF